MSAPETAAATATTSRGRPLQPVRVGAAPSGAGHLPDRAGDPLRHPRLHAARAIGRPAVHVPRDGDPHLLAGRDRARRCRNRSPTGSRRKLQETPSIDFLRSYSRPGESLIFFTMKDSAPVEGRARRPGTRCARKSATSRRRCRKACRDRSSTTSSATSTPTSTRSKATAFRRRNCTTTPTSCARCCCACRASRKVDYFGDQDQHIYVEIANTQLTRLGISPQQTRPGDRCAERRRARRHADHAPTTACSCARAASSRTCNALADTLIRVNERSFRLGDIATIKRGYVDPPVTQMRVGGQAGARHRRHDAAGRRRDPASARRSTRRPPNCARTCPPGSSSSKCRACRTRSRIRSTTFVEAVAEAVAIVLVVSLVSLGVRTGMVVVISIPVVLAVTALCMYLFDIGLHKVSLGTLMLALGLLVDDAIIAVEMMAVKLEQGWNRTRAAAFAYTSTAFPMLTGTLVTVSGFLPIALAKSSTGEYTRSIFEVSAIALIVSWLAAVVLIPLLGYTLLPERKREAHERTPTITNTISTTRVLPAPARLDRLVYRAALRRARRHRRAVRRSRWRASRSCRNSSSRVRTGRNCSSICGCRKVPRSRRRCVRRSASKRRSQGRPEIDHFVDFVGTGAPRFYLPLDQQLAAAELRAVRDHGEDRRRSREAGALARTEIARRILRRSARVCRGSRMGRRSAIPVQFRVSGDDIATVRSIAEQVAADMRADRAHDATCSSTGTSRPSARCASRSTRRRRANSASRRRTCRTSSR